MHSVAEDGWSELAPAAAATTVASARIDPRGRRSGRVRLAGLAVALLALVGMCLLSVWVGANHLPFTVVWRVLWHNDGSPPALVVHDLRIPRTLLGLAVGAALGVAGALTQALTRNDLAEPGLLGVNIGASAAVVVGISVFGVTDPAGYVWFAFVGAGITSVAVFAIGSAGRGAETPATLVVTGAAATALLGAFVNAVLLLDTATFDQIRFWDVGSLAAPGAPGLTATWPFIVVGILLAVSLARPLNALALGEESARGLGVHLFRARAVGALAVVLLCGAATTAAGPIAFVGLAVPHAARAIAGPDHRWVLPYSGLLAAILLIGADLVGRVIIAQGELRVGVVAAFVGAPVFIALCRRARLVQR
ncbi:FecCD family ABC transporter permease [Candidatus Frankia alpina]|uniref:FecCD family ABC transporter permease n=1 Tax=Candidatus Frankia alpina TaxID=2699483 RepID=UPI0013D51C10|nr:iron chelate uptake ABC transporter family permease subunit [Candidatus Frankia alpina]